MKLALPDDFRDLLVSLADAGARFVVVGGHAFAFHGHIRATKDLDVYIEPSPGNARRVERGLVSFGAPLQALGVSVSDFERPDITVQFGVPPFRIDLLTAADGIDFDEAWSTHETLTVDGRAIPVLGRDALVKNKLASGRTQDLADVEPSSSIVHRRAPSVRIGWMVNVMPRLSRAPAPGEPVLGI